MNLTATNIVIATGAKCTPIARSPFAGALIDSTQAWKSTNFLVGGDRNRSPIALEFASMWNAAGSGCADSQGPCAQPAEYGTCRRPRAQRRNITARSPTDTGCEPMPPRNEHARSKAVTANVCKRLSPSGATHPTQHKDDYDHGHVATGGCRTDKPGGGGGRSGVASASL